MKQYGFKYSDFEEMQSFVNSNNINKSDNVLIQVFAGIIEFKVIDKIIEEITSVLPQGEIIGTTTAGEIYEGKAFNNTVIISFTVFDNVKIRTQLFSHNNEYELGMNVAKELIQEDTKIIILFADGLLTNGQEIVKGIESINSDIIICGGKAGDNGYLKETFVFTKNGITKKGVVAASLSGKKLNVITEHNFSWEPIGKLMTVTEAIDNRIITIDNVKAVDVYKRYLGDEVAMGLPMSATEFPLIVKKNNNKIARVAFERHDDGALSFLGDVQVDDKVQFGYGNITMIKSNVLEIANRLKNKNIEGIFVYSCSVRKSFMKDEINLETNILNNIAPTFGFFTYGEFFTFSNLNKEVLNVTMTLIALSEGEQTFQKNEISINENQSLFKNFFEGKDLGVIKAFANLVNQVTKELQQTNEILEEQKSKIEKMKNVTKSIMEINSHMLSSCEIDSLFQMVLDKALEIIPKGKIGSVLVLKDYRFHYRAINENYLKGIEEITYGIDEVYPYRIYNINKLHNPIIIKNVKKELFENEYIYDYWRSFLLKDPYELITCGVSIDGNTVAFINIYSINEEESFNEEDKDLLKYLCYDISVALKNAQLLENILYMSKYDSLTGLYNRHYFRKLLNETLNKAKYSKTTFIICMLDLNKFKIINDIYGHDVGDKMLSEFATIFKREICKNDILGRIGGDEFAVIFINKSRNEVINTLNKVYSVFKNNSFNINGEKKEISFAYGFSQFLEDSKDIDELLRIADKRMYERKRKMKESDNLDK